MTTGPESPQQPDEPQPPAHGQPPQGQQPPPTYGQPPQGQQPPPTYGQPPQGQPPAGYGQPPAYGPPMPYAGQPPMRPEDEKLWAIAAHLGPLLVGLFAPLVVWLVFKDRSPFLDRSAKEALNMQISYAVYGIVAGLSILLLIGLVLLPLVGIAWLVLMIIGTIKAANLEEYRYPAIFRLVS